MQKKRLKRLKSKNDTKKKVSRGSVAEGLLKKRNDNLALQKAQDDDENKEKFITLEKHEIIVNNLYDELRRKDEQIKELKEKNILLIQASLHQAKRNAVMSEAMQHMDKVIDGREQTKRHVGPGAKRPDIALESQVDSVLDKRDSGKKSEKKEEDEL